MLGMIELTLMPGRNGVGLVALVANHAARLRLMRTLVLVTFPLARTASAAAGWAWQNVPGGRLARLAVPAAGKTGFTLLTGAQTGIRFTNALDDRLIMQNNNFMEGAGVALGDFDGDGWCDLSEGRMQEQIVFSGNDDQSSE